MDSVVKFFSDPINKRAVIILIYFLVTVVLSSFVRRLLWAVICRESGTSKDEAYLKIKQIRSSNLASSMNMARAEFDKWFFNGAVNENKARRLKLIYDISVAPYFLSALFVFISFTAGGKGMKLVNFGVVLTFSVLLFELFLCIVNIRFPKTANKITLAYERVAYSRALDIILGVGCIVIAVFVFLSVIVNNSSKKNPTEGWTSCEARIASSSSENGRYSYTYDYNIFGETYYGSFTDTTYRDIGDKLTVRYNPDNYEESAVLRYRSGNYEFAFYILSFVFLFLGLWSLGVIKPLLKKASLISNEESTRL